ncbi:MAG: phosphate propanoyltransferase [Candidatus Staskawiczbacteria bacterium]|nr:phosphate propanoyltransferase [Candidatus Staskawiczbacteria bacterium]
MFGKQKIIVPVEVSARHCHLAKEDLEKLFGEGYELQKLKQLSQPSDFACQETVDIQFGSKKIEKVRVVGPVRAKTQVEISLTDAVGSGVVPQIRLSGDLNGTSPVVLVGPKGTVNLNEGLIVALRHIHCATSEAAKLGLKNGSKTAVRIDGARQIVFENISVRVRDDYKFCLHLDTDEGNAAGINKAGEGIIIK